MTKLSDNKGIAVLFSFYAAIAGFTIYFFDGTGDAGDSIQHYLFARHAPYHPELFFNHWAKPVYVLLASPFAQFGFTGVKIFNALATLASIFLTYKIAKQLQLKNAVIAALISVFTPLYFILTFSGLTEPLFALFVSASIYLTLKERYIPAALILSFLPFVRSEGLLIIGIFGIYFLLRKKWKPIPLLITGHTVYALVGFFIYGDLLWVFTQIPYASLSSPYGSGKLFHFVEQLVYVLGVPLCILFWLGVINIIRKAIQRRTSTEILVLFFLNFLVFLVAHSVFWYFGIFNSMGLKRVFLGIMPVMAIVALEGYNFISEEILAKRKIAGFVVQVILVLYIIVFPFTGNPASVNWKKDMKLSFDQELARKTVDFIRLREDSGTRFIYAHPYLSEILDIDCFDPEKRLELNEKNLANLRSGDIVIWENWYAVIESGTLKERLDNDARLENIFSDSAHENKILYAVYEYK